MLYACNQKYSLHSLIHFLGTICESLGRAWSDCGACQALSKFLHVLCSPALSCFQASQNSGIHTPPTCLISLGRQLPQPEHIRDITWPGPQFWQLQDWNKEQYNVLFLPDSLSMIFMANKGKFHFGSKFENSGCLKHFLSFSLSYTDLCFHGNRNENLLAACRQAADDSFLYQISAVDFQITAPRTHCNNKHRDFSTILALPVCITLL